MLLPWLRLMLSKGSKNWYLQEEQEKQKQWPPGPKAVATKQFLRRDCNDASFRQPL